MSQTEAARVLIRRRFGITVSSRTVRRYLAHWGFTPQKPRRAAYERDPEAVTRWLEEEYPAIRAKARQAKARIDWGDEMSANAVRTTDRNSCGTCARI
jgi:hypothetical protein